MLLPKSKSWLVILYRLPISTMYLSIGFWVAHNFDSSEMVVFNDSQSNIIAGRIITVSSLRQFKSSIVPKGNPSWSPLYTLYKMSILFYSFPSFIYYYEVIESVCIPPNGCHWMHRGHRNIYSRSWVARRDHCGGWNTLGSPDWDTPIASLC